ncbi:hypothetical protein CRUP_008517 [Coryphaenoides rupestris]|nr:hypothetical protein CRUP_008517 [Coryphaenoides rupestris]
MTHVINQGMSMYWGTSRWSAMEIMEAYSVARQFNLIPPVCEQAEYHFFQREKVETQLPELYHKIGKSCVGVVSWSPLACGIITGKYDNGIPETSRASMKVAEQLMTMPTRSGVNLFDRRRSYAGGKWKAEEIQLVITTKLYWVRECVIFSLNSLRNHRANEREVEVTMVCVVAETERGLNRKHIIEAAGGHGERSIHGDPSRATRGGEEEEGGGGGEEEFKTFKEMNRANKEVLIADESLTPEEVGSERELGISLDNKMKGGGAELTRENGSVDEPSTAAALPAD